MEGEVSVEVPGSEDQGNVSIMTEPVAPSPAADTTATPPADPKEPVATTDTPPVEPELFELPDGRKVDAATIAQEYRNLLPEFTRKSQELAELTKGKAPVTQPNQPANPLFDPNYVPQTYAELAAHIEAQTLAAIEAREKAAEEARTALETKVVEQLTEVKKLDPNVNESALFQHAVKYGFQNLVQAFQNMKDMSTLVKTVQTTTAQNIAKRNDPVSVTPGASGARPDPSHFSSAVEYLRSVKT